jgi:hypothetical protein
MSELKNEEINTENYYNFDEVCGHDADAIVEHFWIRSRENTVGCSRILLSCLFRVQSKNETTIILLVWVVAENDFIQFAK